MTVIIALCVLILSIVAHEVAHGYAANALGDPTARLAGRLTLNPVPHLDPVGSILVPALLVLTGSSVLFGWAKPVPYNPFNLKHQRWGETLVALAGPATNIFLAVVFALVIRFAGPSMLSGAALSVASTIVFVNLFLGLFNLIPFPPLDGYGILRSALPWSASHAFSRFEAQVRSMGALSLLLFLLIFSYIFAGPFFMLVTKLFSLLVGNGTL
jgi:Zn-dependent protease